MSEKIGIARAEIVDLLSLILRTHSRDELFSLFRSAEGIMPKEDPEAWREDCRKRQADGVKFQRKSCGEWLDPINMFDFSGNKEDYREVPQEDLNLKPTGDRWYEMQIEQPAIGVISGFNKWDRALTEKEISDLFSGKVRPEDIPQEASNVKETGVGIPEAARNILIAWQRSGLKFLEAGEPVNFPLKFDCTMKGNYTIPGQPIPEGMSVETVEAMWRQGLMLEFDGNFGWDLAADGFDWNGIYRGAQLLARLRIPAQPIPEKLLKVPSPTPHAAERALWKAQREAGTNEVWQEFYPRGMIVTLSNHEPDWRPDCEYRVKPKTVKYYFALIRNKFGTVDSLAASSMISFNRIAEKNSYIIIGDIEEREVEA